MIFLCSTLFLKKNPARLAMRERIQVTCSRRQAFPPRIASVSSGSRLRLFTKRISWPVALQGMSLPSRIFFCAVRADDFPRPIRRHAGEREGGIKIERFPREKTEHILPAQISAHMGGHDRRIPKGRKDIGKAFRRAVHRIRVANIHARVENSD